MATTKKYIVTITNYNRGNSRKTEAMTLGELIEYFSYTLDTGASYAWERGNKKINTKPTTIKSLMSNLRNAKNNAARDGDGGTDFDFIVA